MSSIAYVTDSKMLELHRLNNNSAMNFWRLSNNINFSDFSIGDLVFFLSKDKELANKKEKGIVGFGMVKSINLNSINYMWKKYGVLNGYNSITEFKDAIKRVSKSKKLPGKISSFYLEDCVFFQPIYLSECGLKISNNVESYIYLNNETTLQLLELSKSSNDLWSSLIDNNKVIKKQEILTILFDTHKQLKDVKYEKINTIKKALLPYLEKGYDFIPNSVNELYKIDDNNVEIIFYNDKKIDQRILIGQAQLYRHYLSIKSPYDLNINFKTSNDDKAINYQLNILK